MDALVLDTLNVLTMKTYLAALLPKLFNAAMVGLAGWFAVKFAIKLFAAFLKKSKIDPILHAIILSVTRIVLLVLLAISVLDVLGVPTTSLITSLGAVGLAVSLAVKDSIGNLAGGVILLLVKPFSLGDYIEVDGSSGTVAEIGLLQTLLLTPDNKRIFIPNDIVSKAKIVNYTAEPVRRLDNVFSVGYEDDYDRACKILAQVVAKSPLALSEPAPVIRMLSHSPSSIDIACRVWVHNKNYYELNFWLQEHVKKAFDENGINIPYNQLDVHITDTTAGK